jgi:hypothetical protein
VLFLALRKEHNDVADFIYSFFGVAYAVLLAFVIIVVWQEHETAKNTVESEANEFAGDYFLADRSPTPVGRVQGLVRSYARTVVEEEWPLMERSEASECGEHHHAQLRFSLQDVDASTGAGRCSTIRSYAGARGVRREEAPAAVG